MQKIQVLMSTYNGEKYVSEQIESILSQTGVKTAILVRDDGSKDKTLKILEEYRKKGSLEYYAGANIGYIRSFMDLLFAAPDAEYYAFSDQDDVWCPTKLLRATTLLSENNYDKPACYFSNLKVVDADLKYKGIKDFKGMKLTLGSILVRQRAAGCTIVFNKELAEVIRNKDFENADIKIGHDNWIFLVCLCIGGRIIYDKKSLILFRRHNSTITGIGGGLKKRITNEIKIFGENRNVKQRTAELLLEKYRGLSIPSHIKLLEAIVHYRNSFADTICLLFNKELRCGIKIVDLMIKMAILFRRF